MRKIPFKSKCLLLVLPILFSGTTSLFANQQKSQKSAKLLVVTKTTARIHKFPSENYKAIATAQKGDKFIYYGLTRSGWYQIQYQDQVAYIKADKAARLQRRSAPSELAPSVVPKEKSGESPSPPPEQISGPVPQDSKSFPWIWVILAMVLAALYILYFMRNVRRHKEFENYLRRKPSQS